MNFFQKIWATPFVHGLVMTITGAVIGGIISSISNGHFPSSLHDLTPVWQGASVAVGAYLTKNGIIGSSNITPDK